MLAGGALPAGFGRAVMAQDGGAEYHAAYPYLDPGAGGHFNSYVTNAILTQVNPTQVYGDLILQPLGMYYWASGEWLPLLATEWSFIQAGGRPRRLPRPRARRSSEMIASSICSRSWRSSVRILLTSIVISLQPLFLQPRKFCRSFWNG